MQSRARLLLVIAVALVAIVAGAVSYAVLVSGSSKPPSSPPSGPAVCSESGGGSTAGNWTTYHQNNVRSGVETSTNISAVHARWAEPTSLDADVYAEPLVCGNTVYVGTEGNTVYAVNASTGTVIWHTHLGTPVTSSTLPCGDIGPTTGITGTPVIDVATGILYAVAFLSPHQHVLFGLTAANGSVVSQVGVDPTGADPTVEQERGALTLANGYVYVVYGGLYGDCGDYHGWVVGAPVSGSGGLVSYQVPTQREGGIWGTAGMGVAANGDLYVATGNGASTTTFDHGDAVIELSPTLTELGYFAPTNWVQLNEQDGDLGSVAPTVLPNGDVFQIGKGGVGYLLSGTDLGGIGGQISEANVCNGAYGGTAHVGFSILVPCLDGVFDVVANATNLSVAWQSSTEFDAGSPIVTGNVVWSVDISNAELLGFNVSNGQQLFSFPLGSVDHFISPAAGPGSLYVGAGSQLDAFTLS
ncbi:MAG TPA: PQQ-binding-like beta-propeller repeat protein [Thermoplasmata archaeon]|nr:PQQ-binding-like beta-propeller repeat protein [Thermoplasmata archaeon]